MSLPSLPIEITTFFPNHSPYVVKNLMIVSEGVFSAKTTNLWKVKDELGNILSNQSSTKPESNYTRLIRFFKTDEKDQESLIKSLLCVIFCLINKTKSRLKYLALDGTSWELGVKKIHLLVLSVIIEGIAVPICWEELDKKGTSNFGERKELLEKACDWYNLEGMILLADREYIGEQWFNFLVTKGIEFIIRIKRKTYRNYIDQQVYIHPENNYFKEQKWRYSAMENRAVKARNIHKGVSKQIQILTNYFTFVVFKNPKNNASEKLLYFLSTLKDKSEIIQNYPIRWAIECCFKHLKSNGFNLEEVNFKSSHKIKLMMAIVCFLYVIAIYHGLLESVKKKKSDLKKYANGKISFTVSIFRKGLSIISGKFRDFLSFVHFIKGLIHLKSTLNWVHV